MITLNLPSFKRLIIGEFLRHLANLNKSFESSSGLTVYEFSLLDILRLLVLSGDRYFGGFVLEIVKKLNLLREFGLLLK